MVVYKPRAEASWKPNQYVERGIQYLGPNRFRAFIRQEGVDLNERFMTLDEARRWRIMKLAEVLGKTHVDKTIADKTTVEDACAWALAKLGKPPYSNANDKNLASKWRWWQSSKFAKWKISALNPKTLRRWAREVLMADVGDDEADKVEAEREVAVLEGGGKPPSVQTVVHRLNALSRLFQDWSIANELDEVDLPNPVNVRGVRPKLSYTKRRRLKRSEEERLLKAAPDVRPWLKQAIIIAIDTCARQTELATLQWDNVYLDDEYPKMELLNTKDGQRTKNTLDRTTPLSDRAIAAFRELKEMADIHNATEKNNGQWTKPLPVLTGRGIIHAWADLMERIADAPDSKAIDDLTWHCLRHEGVSRLFEGKGVKKQMTDTEIMAISGHLGRDQLERYTHLRAAQLRDKPPSPDSDSAADGAGTVRLRPDGTFHVKNQKGRWVPATEADKISKLVAQELLKDALTALETNGAAQRTEMASKQ